MVEIYPVAGLTSTQQGSVTTTSHSTTVVLRAQGYPFTIRRSRTSHMHVVPPICNQRFTVQPAQVADLHRPRPAHREWTASCDSRRPLPAQGFHHCASGGRYQIHAMVRAPRVLVGEHGDGTMRPMKTAEAKTVYQPRRPVTPRPDHPWRQRLRPERRTEATVARP